jgi:hypothetical protein
MLTLPVLAVASVTLGGLVWLGYRPKRQWTGLPAAPADSDGKGGRSAKTLWDWLQLLGIPAVLVLATIVFTASQSRQEHARAKDAEYEATLHAYLAQMSELVLDRRLLRSRLKADVRNIARTITLTTVRRLDGPRRGLVVRFLGDASLLRSDEFGGAPVVVSFADLQHAELAEANLSKAILSKANLGGAILSKADLGGADLRKANLSSADLRRAALGGADLHGANVLGADFRGATGANLADTRGEPVHRP